MADQPLRPYEPDPITRRLFFTVGWLVIMGLLIAILVIEVEIRRDARDAANTSTTSTDPFAEMKLDQLQQDLSVMKERLGITPTPAPTGPQVIPPAKTGP